MYKSIHEVPKAWRSLDGWPLSLDQINEIVGQANESKAVFAVALGEAKGRFKETHTVKDGLWVVGVSNVTE